MVEDTKKKGRKTARGRVDTSLYGPSSSSSSNPNQFLRDPREFIREHEIRDKLGDATINRELRVERFITHKRLRGIWEDLLVEFLGILGFENRPALVENVFKDLLKTMSILVAIKWEDWALFGDLFLERRDNLVRHDRKDSSLPHSLSKLGDESFLGNSWAGDFLSTQYTYLPIVVEEGVNTVYSRTRPLPFIRSKTKLIAEGGYGVVTKEVIACHQFKPLTNYDWQDLNTDEHTVARKYFPAKGDFRKEARNLENLNSSLSDHKRIVKYLAIITVGDENDHGSSKEFNILMPLADTDLKQFLYQPTFEGRCGGVTDLILEAANLADAIRWLHEGQPINGKVMVCCHMDLKLDNVLVYFNNRSDVGWWKISDFGISSLIDRDEMKQETNARRPSRASYLSVDSPAASLARITGTAKTTAKRPAGTYSAPEVDLGSEIGPKSDIWSFGCVLYQVLARTAGGIRLLTELDEQRGSMENGSTDDHFCQRTFEGKILHRSVSKWLNSNESLREGNFRDRSMVMNCKRLISKTLSMSPGARPTAKKLHSELLEVAHGRGQEFTFDQYYNMLMPQIHIRKQRPLDPRETPAINFPPSASFQPPFQELGQQKEEVPTSRFYGLPNPMGTIPAIREDPGVRKPPTPPPEPPPETQADNPLHVSRSTSMSTSAGPSNAPISREILQADQLTPESDRFVNFVRTSPELRQDSGAFFPPGHSRQNSEDIYDRNAESRPKNTKGELIPFRDPPEKVFATLISSTRAKIAFISEKNVVISTLYAPWSREMITAPDECTWEKASLDGDFFALRGTHGSAKNQIFRLYKLSTVADIIHFSALTMAEEVPYFEKLAVSRDGRILIGNGKKVWLYQDYNASKKLLYMGNPNEDKGKLQKVWFSTNGLLAFAWFSLPNGLHHIRLWGVSNNDSGCIKHQIPESSQNPGAVKGIVQFTKSPMCLMRKENDIISLIQRPEPANGHYPQLKHLQAMVVTPNEKAVIFIRNHRLPMASKISVGKIIRKSGGSILGEVSKEVSLRYHLDKTFDVAIEEKTSTDRFVRVLIAHGNGNFEMKDVDLPAS